MSGLDGGVAWSVVEGGLPPGTFFGPREVARSEVDGRAGEVRWSWSTLELLQTCPRKFLLAVVERVRPTGYDSALRIGVTVHTALEVFWRYVLYIDGREGGGGGRDDPAGLEAAVEAALVGALRVIDEDPRIEAGDRLVAERVVRYFGLETAQDQVRRWVPLWIEGVLSVDLRGLLGGRGGAIPWEARPDLIVEEREGLLGGHPGVWVVDHKTASTVRPGAFTAYRQDGQALGNVAAAILGGWPDVLGFVPNLLGKESTPSFERGYVRPVRKLLSEFARTVRTWQAAYRGRCLADVWPRVHAACVGRYGLCSYYDPCEEGAGMAPLIGSTSYPGFARPGEDGASVDDGLLGAMLDRISEAKRR